MRAEAVEAALADDLNTPLALACLHETASALRKCTNPDEQARLLAVLRDSADLLGLLQADPTQWRQQGSMAATGQASGPSSEQIESLIAARQVARTARDFARADALRQELATQGIGIEDSASGTTWHRLHAELVA